jgi:acetyl-CoA carboxylase biotin carboxyl carrier protein
MKFEDVKNLIKLIQENDISEVEIEEPNLRIRISRNFASNETHTVREDRKPIFHTDKEKPDAIQGEDTLEHTGARSETTGNLDDDRYKKVYAPLVGTYYRSPAPDADPFIQEGDVIEKGTVICIIEAMKVMNEIESEHGGRVVAIPVENATPVEYGEPICIIDPFV